MPEGYIILTLVADEEDGQFAAHCPELGTATCGDTIEEALANLQEAVTVHLGSLEEVGTRQQVFAERTFEVHESATEAQWTIPVGQVLDKVVKPICQRIPAVSVA